MNIYLGVLFGVFHAMIVALGKVALKKSLNEFPPSVSFFLETIFGVILWIPFAFIFSHVTFSGVLSILPYVVISAILSEAYIFYIYSKGDLSVIGSVFATYSIYTIIFSRLLNNEILKPTTLIFIFITISGTLILSMSPALHFDRKKHLHSVLWALSGAVAVGFSDTISKTAIDNTSTGSFLLTLALVQIPVSIIYLKLERQSLRQVLNVKKEFNRYRLSIISALLISIAMIFFWLSFQFTFASIASPITATNVMFILIFARLFLNERLLRRSLMGIIVIVAGIIGVNVL